MEFYFYMTMSGAVGFVLGVIATHLLHYRLPEAPKPLEFIDTDPVWKTVNSSYTIQEDGGAGRNMTESEKKAFVASMDKMHETMDNMFKK